MSVIKFLGKQFLQVCLDSFILITLLNKTWLLKGKIRFGILRLQEFIQVMFRHPKNTLV